MFDSKWFIRALLVSGPAAILAMELGWVTTEVGRQPWIVHNVMRTEEAVTDAGFIWYTFIGLVLVYAVITYGAFLTLRTMTRRWDAGDTNIPSPYGPSELTHHEKKSIIAGADDDASGPDDDAGNGGDGDGDDDDDDDDDDDGDGGKGGRGSASDKATVGGKG